MKVPPTKGRHLPQTSRVARWGNVSAEIKIGTDKNEIVSAKNENGTDGETTGTVHEE